jgi:hypothetical protein
MPKTATTVELTPELRDALTKVYDIAQQAIDRSDGICWDDDPDMCDECKACKLVQPFTHYGPGGKYADE